MNIYSVWVIIVFNNPRCSTKEPSQDQAYLASQRFHLVTKVNPAQYMKNVRTLFFPEIIFLELNMFFKKSSETVKSLRKCNRTAKKNNLEKSLFSKKEEKNPFFAAENPFIFIFIKHVKL